MGTVVEGSAESQSRLTKRERKGSMLQELLADSAIRKRAKTQFLKSQEAASSGMKRRRPEDRLRVRDPWWGTSARGDGRASRTPSVWEAMRFAPNGSV